ncbi:hypothetical protein CRT23_25860 [Methylobacterium sp. V23]|nr:hypothetical protein CRT23_25860 [Methylobacterium sp. V23]
MRRLWVTALVGLSFLGALSSASAQRVGRDYDRDERSYGSRSYGERDGGYDDDDDDDGPRERGRSYDNGQGNERRRRYDEDRDRHPSRGYDNNDRGRKRNRGSEQEPEAAFDEDEYLRCNADVRRAVEQREMASGEFHYRTFGRREKRQLTCPMKL